MTYDSCGLPPGWSTLAIANNRRTAVHPIRLLHAIVLVLAFLATDAALAGDARHPDDLGVRAQVELEIPSGARAGSDFDADRATAAWLATLSADQRARSDAYFEGGYWLQLWSFLWGLAVAALILFTRLSAWLRDRTAWTRFPALNAGFYGAGYIVAAVVLSLPLSLYAGWWREHAYDLSNLTLAEWLIEQAKSLGVSAVMGVIGLTVLYAVFRRARRLWWLWGAGAAIVLMTFSLLLAPVFIQPMFNDYKPLPEGELRDEILSLARANRIDADEIWWFDASRQHSRVSANVAGFGPTTRIALNDNLLMRSSQAAIEAVMGHEMGHFVLGHTSRLLTQFALVLVAGFAFVAWGFGQLVERFGTRWRVSGIEDPAGFPVLVAMFSVYFFAMTPVTNSISRAGEMEADLYGLNSARQPDGFAEAAMQLSEYRKIDPHWLEEIIFYTHPSGRRRVETAMRWKAENLELFTDGETPSG